MKITRILALVLALTLCCSVGLAESPAITDQEGASVSILAMNSWYSTVDLSNATLLNEIADRANVTIKWNLLDPTSYADSVSPMLASGQDLPDIVQLPDLDPQQTYLSSGMFVALDEHFDIMPNYKKYLMPTPSSRRC